MQSRLIITSIITFIYCIIWWWCSRWLILLTYNFNRFNKVIDNRANFWTVKCTCWCIKFNTISPFTFQNCPILRSISVSIIIFSFVFLCNLKSSHFYVPYGYYSWLFYYFSYWIRIIFFHKFQLVFYFLFSKILKTRFNIYLLIIIFKNKYAFFSIWISDIQYIKIFITFINVPVIWIFKLNT